MWCIAELDQAYIQKMEDVLAVYEKPYNPAQPVVCLDEKPIPLHADVRPPKSAKPGKLAKQDNEYQRCGTANVFGVVEPKGGRHFTTATSNRSGAGFARMVKHVVEQYPAADTIHLVMDNLNIHCRKSLTDRFGEQKGGDLWDRLRMHYTPKHGSWLDQAEIELRPPDAIRNQNAESEIARDQPLILLPVTPETDAYRSLPVTSNFVAQRTKVLVATDLV